MSFRIAAAMLLAFPAHAQSQAFAPEQDDPLQAGRNLTAPIQISDSIWMAVGFGNTYLVKTPAGSVIVDTSFLPQAPQHRKLLEQAQPGNVRYIILTHGHADHTGGVDLWRQAGTKLIVQKQFIEFRQHQVLIGGFLGRRSAAQFGLPPPPGRRPPDSSHSGHHVR
ncbi:MAG: MBL fold metallo-hydrolase [Bryobacterales bacterium]|nr:MBL fold metallo-hydrolase [Bryobacterales bacterium]